MPIIATENQRLSNVVKQELWPDTAYCRDVVVVNEAAAQSYIRGTVLGQVTADGKYRIAVETETNGSEDVKVVVMQEYAIPATTDVSVLVLKRGPAVLSKIGLRLHASFDNDTKRNAAYAQLEALGFSVNDAV